MTDAYDVIVIGSGAGGGTLVNRLAPSGKRILLLEHALHGERDPGRRLRPPGRHLPLRRRRRDLRARPELPCPRLDNLYVVDTSFFPSIGAVNPGLTAMANALRVGDHLLDRLGANGG